ncbi:MAG: hypothetical protein EA403_14015 [Spirochaetaceae bacterium]|nr:MAG: hypothetical protein EA403_14015 [Spirochaetaceae bacterium]
MCSPQHVQKSGRPDRQPRQPSETAAGGAGATRDLVDRTVIPIQSSLFLGDDYVALLTEHRIHAMTMKGDTMDLVNADAIRARGVKSDR